MPDDVPNTGAATSISVCRGGPLLIRGDFHLLSDEGSRLDEQRKTIALCRCGHSERKPFCDGSHRRFWATPRARPERDRLLELTAGQLSLWHAQHVIGDVPLAIAHVIDIRGDIDLDRLIAVSYQAGAEYGTTTARIVTTPDGPRMSSARNDFVIGQVDLRGESDPADAGRRWMRHACAAPMDLTGDPLVETTILRVGDQRWFYFSRAHHIVLDGFGALNLLRRTAELYRSTPEMSAGEPEILVDADMRYQQSARRRRDREYWAEVMSGLPDPVSMGIARAAPSVDAERVSENLRRGAATALDECCRDLDTLPSAVLIAGIAAYVARVVDAQRIVVSLPVSARNTARLRSAAGSVSNIVPLVVDAHHDLTRDDYVAGITRGLSELLRHQQYRHEDMLRDADVAATGLHQFGPVINVFPFAPRIPLGDVDADYTVLTTGPVADLNVNLYSTADGAGHRIELEGNPAGFAAGAIRTHHRQLETFLEDFARIPGSATLGDLPLPAPAVHGVPAPAMESPADIFRRGPTDDTIAVADGPSSITFAELRSRATSFARRLHSAGLGPETAAAVLVGRSVDAVVAFWAVVLTGGVYVPIDPRYPRARIEQILAACGPQVIVENGLSITPVGDCTASPVGDGTASPVGDGTSNTAEPRSASSGRPRPQNVAYEIFTSGSTGTPKGVAVTGTGLAALAAEIQDSYRLGTGCVVAHFASPSFDTAIVEMVAAHICGARLQIIDPAVAGGDELARALTAGGVSHLFITPAALSTLDPSAASTVREVIVGGDVCPPSVARRWITAGVRLRCAYGPTETTCSVTITETLDAAALVPVVPIGRAMPGVELWVLDSRLRPQPVAAVGELYVGGPALARGYLTGPATAVRFVAHPFSGDGARLYRTGDRVVRRADGTLDFVGRRDDQLKIRGFRVETGEVDAVLRGLSGVDDAITVGTARGSHTVLSSYVTGTGLSADELRGSLRKVLPEFLIPASITVLTDMPLTTAGKIDRAALPEVDAATAAAYRAPASQVEFVCTAAFSAVLASDGIGADHDFFASGGDSLSATHLVSRINDDLDSSLTVRDVFEMRTPAGIATRVVRPDPLLRHRDQPPGGVPLTPAQRNVDLDDRTAANLIPFAVHAPGVDRGRLADALAAVVAAHPLLTASFDGDVMRPNAVAAPTVRDIDRPVTEFVHEGFDLAAASGLRIGLREDTIAVSAHHAVIDGVSLRVVLSDLLTAYQGGYVPKRDLDYFDYAQWMADTMGDAGDAASPYARQLTYWRDALSQSTPVGPIDGHPRPDVWDRRGARHRVDVPARVWDRMAAAASSSGTTTLSVLRAAVAVGVARRADCSDLVIGTPVDGRRDARLTGVVGMFVNTLPIRYRIDRESIADVARRHVDVEREAFRHSDIGYLDVARALDDVGGPHHPLFQVVVSGEDADVALPGIQPMPPDIAKCDLHFALTPPSSGRPGVVDVLYPTSMFDGGWVRGFTEEILGSV